MTGGAPVLRSLSAGRHALPCGRPRWAAWAAGGALRRLRLKALVLDLPRAP